MTTQASDFLPWDIFGQDFTQSGGPDYRAFVLEATWGIFLGLAFGVLAIITLMLWNRPIRTGRTWVLFFAPVLSLTLLMYIGVSVVRILWKQSTNMICLAWAPQMGELVDEDGPVAVCNKETFEIFDPYEGPSGQQQVSFYITQVALLWISDTTIAYRASLLARSKRTQAVIGTLWALFTVTGILALLSESLTFVPVSYCPSAGILCTPKFANQVSFVFMCSSVASNVTCTVVFAWILWKHRIAVQSLKGGRHPLTLRILATVVESGVAYCTFQS